MQWSRVMLGSVMVTLVTSAVLDIVFIVVAVQIPLSPVLSSECCYVFSRRLRRVSLSQHVNDLSFDDTKVLLFFDMTIHFVHYLSKHNVLLIYIKSIHNMFHVKRHITHLLSLEWLIYVKTR